MLFASADLRQVCRRSLYMEYIEKMVDSEEFRDGLKSSPLIPYEEGGEVCEELEETGELSLEEEEEKVGVAVSEFGVDGLRRSDGVCMKKMEYERKGEEVERRRRRDDDE